MDPLIDVHGLMLMVELQYPRGPGERLRVSRRGGDVLITHHGRKAATLRGDVAARFLEDVEQDDAQQVMARATGAYKRGEKRLARRHPRNR
jgi:hypothetical protein